MSDKDDVKTRKEYYNRLIKVVSEFGVIAIGLIGLMIVIGVIIILLPVSGNIRYGDILNNAAYILWATVIMSVLFMYWRGWLY